MTIINLKEIENKIYMIRNHKVMLDEDLSILYGVETGQLNRAVLRNPLRFPIDFAFRLTSEELRDLFVLRKTERRHGFPLVFTENGVAMLSSVLHSEQAILVNIAIMRIFTELRNFTFLEQKISSQVSKLEIKTSKTFKEVFERLEDIDQILQPKISEKRKRIGLKQDNE